MNGFVFEKGRAQQNPAKAAHDAIKKRVAGQRAGTLPKWEFYRGAAVKSRYCERKSVPA